MSKAKFRVLGNEEAAFDFVPTGYAWFDKSTVESQGYITVRSASESLTIELDDVPAFIETLNRAVQKAQAIVAKEEAESRKRLEARQQKAGK